MAKDLADKVMLITGATEGIGKAAALDFARRGARLVIVGRNREKSERVVAELELAAGDGAKVELLLGDVSRLDDVRKIAGAFKASYDRLDVLVNNAGAVFADHQLTPDGFEMTFALNHLAYFLLTRELLDVLKKTPGARVVSTSSGAHNSGKLDLATVAKRNGSAGFRAYGDSKLANILFTRELARRLEGSSVVANCFHPGFVQTGFGLNNKGLMGKAIGLAASLFARTPEKGAETLIRLATSPEAGGQSGQYFFDMKPGKTSRRANDDALAKGLWELSERLCA